MSDKDELGGLKPCPFCNKTKTALKPGWRNAWTVICKNLECQAEGSERESRESAMQAWNQRSKQGDV